MKISNAWELPLKPLTGCSIKVIDSDGHPVFDYLGDIPIEDILEVLNGETKLRLIPENYTVTQSEILVDGRLWLRIRGWGYLIGIGGLKLPQEEAINKQKELMSWIISKIG
jgi:hypothetical protein